MEQFTVCGEQQRTRAQRQAPRLYDKRGDNGKGVKSIGSKQYSSGKKVGKCYTIDVIDTERIFKQQRPMKIV